MSQEYHDKCPIAQYTDNEDNRKQQWHYVRFRSLPVRCILIDTFLIWVANATATAI